MLSFDLIRPETALAGVIFASPHSGRDYPEELRMRSALSAHALRSSEDAFVDVLIGAAPALGAPLLLSRTPRAYVDLNRNVDELDPAVIEGVRRSLHNPRVTSGLGVIPRVVSGSRAIYVGKIPFAEAQARLEAHWHPYHAMLRTLVEEQVATFGQTILVDVHSMPHEAIEGVFQGRGRLPDVVLGDRFGASAAPDLMECIEAAFRAEGLRVARNCPFAGAYISQRYGRPSLNQHVVQVELDRALYMDEASIAPNPEFEQMRAAISRVMANIVDLARPDMEIPVAAE